MKNWVFIIILVAAVSFTAWVSASGEADDGQFSGDACDPVVTILETEIPGDPTNGPQPTNTPEPTNTAEPNPTDIPREPKPTKQHCDQGRGNGDDGCSPGNSDNKHGPNDPQKGPRR